jgi:hypothetical protein
MKFLTIEDVCEMLSISRRTLERMRAGSASSIQEMLESKNLGSSSIIDAHEFSAELRSGRQWGRIPFPEPDLYIGKSPRWERDKLLSWLEINGNRL